MKKFFLFRKEEDSVSSGSNTSNTGVGISTISIPADSVSYMTTKKGGLVITFNNSSAFEDTFLKEGQSLPKTTIEIGCAEGEEAPLMEEILNFISNSAGKNVMRFDSVGKNSTFARFGENKEDIKAVVPTLAVDTISGQISDGDAQDEFINKIAGINFYGNLPDIDYNHEGISGFANGDTVTTWTNAGILGSAYNLSPGGGTTPSAVTAANQTNFSQSAVTINLDEYFEVPSYAAKGDYTIYVVLGRDGISPGSGFLYGDADGETAGFIGDIPETGVIGKALVSNNKFSVRHDNQLGDMASVSVDRIFDSGASDAEDDFIPCYSFVIRRDLNSNMIFHTRDGEMTASIESVTGSISDSGVTSGTLLIERLGTTNELVVNVHKGQVARFGIISKDIGAAEASQLAIDLFNFYKL